MKSQAAAATNRCEDCGTALGEICRSGDDWLCFGCLNRRASRGALEGSYVSTDLLRASSPVPVPVPVPSIEGEDRADLDVQLDAYKAGKVEPVQVETRELPAGATRPMRQVLEDLALCSGLLLAAGDDGSVIYAVDWAAKRLGLSGSTVSTALRRLRKCGAIRIVKVLPPVPPRRAGARVYAVADSKPSLQVVR
jgi:DNA-binding transcriptional ArsR family regulator